MSIKGFPAISDPRGVERDLLVAIQNIRQRIEAIEKAYNGTVPGLSTGVQQAQAAATVAAATAINTISVQVNGTLQGKEATLNFVMPAGLTLVGADNSYTGVLTLTFAFPQPGVVFEAPQDGQIYARSNGAWIPIGNLFPGGLAAPAFEEPMAAHFLEDLDDEPMSTWATMTADQTVGHLMTPGG